MTHPPRLLDSSSNDALRSLLSSGLDDAPNAEALPKVATALGLTAVTVAASSLVASSLAATNAGVQAVGAKGAALAGSASAAHAATSAGAAGFWAGSSALALGKTLLVSMVSAGALSVGVVAVHEYSSPTGASAPLVERAGEASPGKRPASGNSPHVRAQQPPVAEVPAVAEPDEGADPQVPQEAADTRPQPGSTIARPSPPGEARPPSVSQASTDADANTAPQRAGVLAREVRQIDSARQALESRDADGALEAIDGYERSRVVGVLDREALLLKIEALSQKQDLEQAKALARQYLQRFPTDAHAPRLRVLLSTTSSSVQSFPTE